MSAAEITARFSPETPGKEWVGSGGKIDEFAVQRPAVALVELSSAADILPVLNIGSVVFSTRPTGSGTLLQPISGPGAITNVVDFKSIGGIADMAALGLAQKALWHAMIVVQTALIDMSVVLIQAKQPPGPYAFKVPA